MSDDEVDSLLEQAQRLRRRAVNARRVADLTMTEDVSHKLRVVADELDQEALGLELRAVALVRTDLGKT